MAASFLASYVSFLLIGVYVLFALGLTWIPDLTIRLFVFTALLANATLYYYFAAYVEMDEECVEKLSSASPIEWWIRVFNNLLLVSLWFLLEFGWLWFSAGLLLLYISFLAWDIVTWKLLKHGYVTLIDALGFLNSAAFVLLVYKVRNVTNLRDAPTTNPISPAPMGIIFVWGATSFAYLVLCILGVRACKFFNPFARKYFSHGSRR